MSHRRKIARRKYWRARNKLYKKYSKELIEFIDSELMRDLREEEDRIILYGEGQPAGPKGLVNG